MNELKSCPFCGCEEIKISTGNIYKQKISYWCCCLNCNARASYFFDEEEAIEAWNRRVKNEID